MEAQNNTINNEQQNNNICALKSLVEVIQIKIIKNTIEEEVYRT